MPERMEEKVIQGDTFLRKLLGPELPHLILVSLVYDEDSTGESMSVEVYGRDINQNLCTKSHNLTDYVLLQKYYSLDRIDFQDHL